MKNRIRIDKYYASEINEQSIAMAQKNYPDTTQLGDITKITVNDLKKLPKIHLLIGGSPCQNLSITVINNLKHNQGLEGEKSSLFYRYYMILQWLQKNNNPNICFLLENVASMKDKDKDVISMALGIQPIMIDSALVSAQDRKRYYWTNIESIEQPHEKGYVLKDVMEDNVPEKYFYQKPFDYHGEDKKVIATVHVSGHDILKRVYNPNFKCATLTACRGGNTQKKVFQNGRCRKLTPTEYERLQTVPEGYTEGFSDSARYNALGDGWTVDIIGHIFSYIPKENTMSYVV